MIFTIDTFNFGGLFGNLNNFSNFPISNLLQFEKVIWCSIFHQAKFWAIFHFSCLFEKKMLFLVFQFVIFLQFFEVMCCLVFHQANFFFAFPFFLFIWTPLQVKILQLFGFCPIFYFSFLFGNLCGNVSTPYSYEL